MTPPGDSNFAGAVAVDLCSLKQVESFDDLNKAMRASMEDIAEGLCQKLAAQTSLTECRDVADWRSETYAVDVLGIFLPKQIMALTGSDGLRPGVAIELKNGVNQMIECMQLARCLPSERTDASFGDAECFTS